MRQTWQQYCKEVDRDNEVDDKQLRAYLTRNQPVPSLGVLTGLVLLIISLGVFGYLLAGAQ